MTRARERNSRTRVSRKFGNVTYIGDLAVFEKRILGYGSCGTIVFEGTFGKRPVAVKRMLRQFLDVA